MTYRQALQWATEQWNFLSQEQARYQAQELLTALLGLDKVDFHLKLDQSFTDEQCTQWREWVHRRAQREPLQHIIGEVCFMDLKLKVNGDVLVPRPETEQLCAWLVEQIGQKDVQVLDLCTGSGAIALSVAQGCPQAQVWGSDISEAALEVARQNASHNGCEVQLLQGDLWTAVPSGQQFDWIVSNPPYIETDVIEQLEPEVKDFDPRLALDGGSDGLECYRRIFQSVHPFLKPGGVLVLEIGDKQGYAMEQLAQESGCERVELMRDDYDCERFCVCYGCDRN